MKESIKKYFYFYSVALILFVTILTLIIVFVPFNQEIRQKIKDNFIKDSELSKQLLIAHINDLANNSKNISNRLILKRKILEYKNADLSFEELKEITLDMYSVAIKNVDDLVESARIVDGKYLFPFDKNILSIDPVDLDQKKEVDILLKNSEEKPYVVVISPILNKDNLLGHDIGIYTIEKFMKTLNQGSITYKLIGEKKLKIII